MYKHNQGPSDVIRGFVSLHRTVLVRVGSTMSSYDELRDIGLSSGRHDKESTFRALHSLRSTLRVSTCTARLLHVELVKDRHCSAGVSLVQHLLRYLLPYVHTHVHVLPFAHM